MFSGSYRLPPAVDCHSTANRIALCDAECPITMCVGEVYKSIIPLIFKESKHVELMWVLIYLHLHYNVITYYFHLSYKYSEV
jgi:hypothetical protein